MKKLLKSLMICLVMTLSIVLLSACGVRMPKSEDAGDVSSMIEDPDSGDYESGQEYQSAADSYYGFNMVLGTDENIEIVDPISGETVLFNTLLDRQIDRFVEELIARLNIVWGTGWGDSETEKIIGASVNDYTIKFVKGKELLDATTPATLKLDDPATYVVVPDGLKFSEAITGKYIWNEVEEGTSDFQEAGTQEYRWAVANLAKEPIKLSVANILAYGTPTHEGTYYEAIAKIDHLGFLQLEKDPNQEEQPQDEVDKIVDYVLNSLIGTTALEKDRASKDAFGLSETVPTDWAGKTLAHNYKAYELLVPVIVQSSIDNVWQKEGEDSLKAYPALPRVTTSQFVFLPSFNPKPKQTKASDEGGGLDDYIDVDEEMDLENGGVDFIEMPAHKEIKSVTFMPKTDVPIVALMLAFEAKGQDENGEWSDITVEMQVLFTLVSNGEVILLDEPVSGVGAEGGVVTVNYGQYDGETNDNSAIFNISDKVKELLSNGTIENENIPSNGIVTVGQYDGEDPVAPFDLYGTAYTTTANVSGTGCVAGLNAGSNYIQLKFSIIKAYRSQANAQEDFNGKVLLRLMVGEPFA